MDRRCRRPRVGGADAGRERAVVVGASIGGILAARVLSGTYRHVTVVERDELPRLPTPRRGVPQARFGHALLARGAASMEGLFPGLLDELVAAGAPVARDLAEMYFAPGDNALYHGPGPLSNVAHVPSRPLLEHTLRERLRATPNVEIVDGCEVTRLLAVAGDVTGVRVRRRAERHEEELPSDLVVDATGRGGRAATWLAELGYQPPRVDEIAVDVKYVSRMLRLQPGAMGRQKLFLAGATPRRPSGLALFGYEDQQWLLTLYGYGGHHPTTDEQDVLDFVQQRAPTLVFDAVKAADPLGELVAHRVPTSLRRRYERMERFPKGLLAFGDAICSFNPIYGQGMAVAALQAEALQRELRNGTANLAWRYFRAAAHQIEAPWQMAVGGDLAMPQVPGHRPLRIRLANRYMEPLQRAAAHDPWLTNQFLSVVGLIEPPHRLFGPRVLARVVAGNARRTEPRAVAH